MLLDKEKLTEKLDKLEGEYNKSIIYIDKYSEQLKQTQNTKTRIEGAIYCVQELLENINNIDK